MHAREVLYPQLHPQPFLPSNSCFLLAFLPLYPGYLPRLSFKPQEERSGSDSQVILSAILFLEDLGPWLPVCLGSSEPRFPPPQSPQPYNHAESCVHLLSYLIPQEEGQCRMSCSPQGVSILCRNLVSPLLAALVGLCNSSKQMLFVHDLAFKIVLLWSVSVL